MGQCAPAVIFLSHAWGIFYAVRDLFFLGPSVCASAGGVLPWSGRQKKKTVGVKTKKQIPGRGKNPWWRKNIPDRGEKNHRPREEKNLNRLGTWKKNNNASKLQKLMFSASFEWDMGPWDDFFVSRLGDLFAFGPSVWASAGGILPWPGGTKNKLTRPQRINNISLAAEKTTEGFAFFCGRVFFSSPRRFVHWPGGSFPGLAG